MSNPEGNETEEDYSVPNREDAEGDGRFDFPSFSELPDFPADSADGSQDAVSPVVFGGCAADSSGASSGFGTYGKPATSAKKKRDGMKEVFSDVFSEAEATDSELSKFLSDSSRRTFSQEEKDSAYGRLRERLSAAAKRSSGRDAELVSEAVSAVDAVMNADANPMWRVSWKYRDGVAKITAALKSSRKAYESAVADEKAELALSVLESRWVSKSSHSERSKDFAREKALGNGSAATESADFAESFAKLAADPKWRRGSDFKTGLEELKKRANLLPHSSERDEFSRLKADRLAEAGLPSEAVSWFVSSMRAEAELAKANPVTDMESYFMKRLARLRENGALDAEFERSGASDFKEFLENKRAEMRENARIVSRHSELASVAWTVPLSDGEPETRSVQEHDFGTWITAFSWFGKAVSDVAASVSSSGLPKAPTAGEMADAAMRVPLVYSVVFSTLSVVSGMAVSLKETALRGADYAEESVRANLPKIVFSTAGFLCLLFVAASAYAGHVGNDLGISVQVNPRLFSPVGYSDSVAAVSDAAAVSASLWKIVGTAFSFMNAFIVFFMGTVLYGTVLSILFELLKVMGTVETELGSETKEAKARLAALAFSLIAVSLVMNSVFFSK